MITGLSHITLIVQDLERSARMVEAVLDGEEIYSSGEKRYSLSRERFFLAGGLWVCLMEGAPLAEATYNHIAFQIPEADFEIYARRVEALGLPLRPQRPRVQGEGRSLYFYDYDNHLFELHTGTLEERMRAYRPQPGRKPAED